MQANQILSSLNNEEKTIIVLPFKYHNYLMDNINNILLNVSLYTPVMLVNEILSNNNIEHNSDSSLIKKIKINNKLKSNEYHNNINFIDQLFKLESEYIASNIDTDNDFMYSEFLDLNHYDFSNITFNCERLIVFEEGLLPIHKQVIAQVNELGVKVEYIENKNETSLYYEYENSIEMLNSIFDSLIEEEYSTLIICDDQVNKDYLKNLADNYGIEYGEVQAEDLVNKIKLQNLFNSIKTGLNELVIGEDIITLDTSDYKGYLENLYDVLISIDIFKIEYLNKLFKALYLNEEVDISLLNKWLVQDLINTLTSNTKANIIFAGSDFNSLYFDRVIIVDASLKSFKPKKVSYLLNVDQRNEISPDLLTNLDYDYDFKQAETRLINCGKQIEYHYCLLDIDNNSNDLAYFIKDLNGLLSKDKKDYLADNKEIIYYLNNNQVTSKIEDTNPININPNLKLNISPSALDTFYKCPYQYLMSYLIRPRINQELNSALIGTVIHDIIHQINDQAIKNDGNYDVDIDEIKSLIESNEEYLNSLTYLDACYHEYYYQYIYAMILNFLRQVSYFSLNSEYKVSEAEQKIIKELSNNTFFKGTIDAVFKYDNDYVVIDYKSSDKLSFDVTKLELGLQNQLISYLKLINHNARVKGAFYQSFKKDKQKVTTSTNWFKALNNDATSKLKGVLFYDNEKIDISSERRALAHFDYQFDIDNDKNHVSNISNIKLKLSDKKISEEEFRNKKDLIQYNSVLEDDYFKILDDNINKMITSIRDGELYATPYSNEDACLYCTFQKVCKNYDPDFVKNSSKEGEEDV